MSINFNYECDECGHTLNNGETAFCTKCFKKLENEVADLEDKVEDLIKENAELKNTVQLYEQEQ